MTTTADEAPPTISLAERAVLSRTVAVVTGKGGILKSSYVSAIAASAARMGMKVLVVDMDSQATVSLRDLGLMGTEHDDGGKSLADALSVTFMTGDPVAPKVVEGVLAYPQANGSQGQVDVVVGGRRMEAAIEAISALSATRDMPYRTVLAKVLTTVAAGYHLVLLDNDPKIKAVRLMVLEAAGFSYAPVDYDIAAYADGLRVLIEEMKQARQTNPDHVFLGAVPGRIPDPTIRAWRKPVPGGAMVEIAAQIQPILDHEVFDGERALLDTYPRIFKSMIHSVPLSAANARKAGMPLVDFLRRESGIEDEGLLYQRNQVLADYDELVKELNLGIVATLRARTAA